MSNDRIAVTANQVGNMNLAQTNGPQLTFDKSHLCMVSPVGCIKEDCVVVKNIGSTAVTYEWKKNIRGDHISAKKSDFKQRFWCHFPRSIIKPGDSKTFAFSFSSEKIGMYNEEWELWTEPLLHNQLPIL